VLETPFNENLALANNGCNSLVLSSLLAVRPRPGHAIQPGLRNEFHAGLQQAFGST